MAMTVSVQVFRVRPTGFPHPLIRLRGCIISRRSSDVTFFPKAKLSGRRAGNAWGGDVRPGHNETLEKSLRAVDIQSGSTRWELPQAAGPPVSAGVISTASGLVFFGENGGAFVAVDGSNGKVLWQFATNHAFTSSPMTYMFDNKQYIAVAAGLSIIAFALPN